MKDRLLFAAILLGAMATIIIGSNQEVAQYHADQLAQAKADAIACRQMYGDR